jgi:hypothetical protein
MSTPQRRCNMCQAPAYPTGNMRIFGGYQEYQCERGHTFWSWAVPTPVRRKKS